MSTLEPSSDFIRYSSNPSFRSKMLAVDAARPKQSSYFHPMTMDPSLVDMFTFPVDSVHPYGQADFSRLPQSYYDDPSLLADSTNLQKASNFPSMPATPPSLPRPHPDPQVSTGSAASGPSIASAPSSAIGSPYSGTAQLFQDNWVNTNHGLGLPAAVMNDLFSNDYMASTMDMDSLYQEKYPGNFVGTSQSPPIAIRSQLTRSSRSFPDPASAKWPRLHPYHLISGTDQHRLLYRAAAQLYLPLSRHIASSLQRQCGPPAFTAVDSFRVALATGLGLRPKVLYLLHPLSSLATEPCHEQR